MVALAPRDERARAAEQIDVHAVERRRKADAAGERVVEVDARFVAEALGNGGASADRRGLALGVVALPEGQAHVAHVAHQQQRSHVLHGKAEAHDAVALVVLRPRQRLHGGARHRQPIGGRVHLLLGQVEFARPDVFVGVELDLLEAHHPRRHVHVAVRAHLALALGDVEHGDLRVRDRGRVVVAVHVANERLAVVVVERFHLVEPALHDVDRLGVQCGRTAREVGFADHLGAGAHIHHHEVVRRDRAQAHRIGGIALARPVPLPGLVAVGIARAVHQAVLAQDHQHLLHVDRAERIGAAERQLERGALHVVHENVQVVGIHERVLGRGVEEIRRVLGHELIDRRARRHHHRRGTRGPPPGAAGTLPGGGNRAGIARHDRHVERADVDAELERVGRDHAAHLSLAQPLLDLAPAQRKVAAAIAADLLGHARHRLEVLFQIRGEDLGGQPALRKHDHLQIAAQELPRHAPRLGQIRTTDAQLAVHHRRIHEHDELLAARRAALTDERERPLGEPLGQLARIGDGGRRADELRAGAVVLADPLQAAQHVAQVAAEHAAIGVQLVDHHVLQVLEELGPPRMVRQHAGMQHVGIGEGDVRPRANGSARVGRRVAIVGVHADVVGALGADQGRERVQLGHLILRERLGRKEVQRPRGRILQDGVEHRQVVAERLARGRGCGDDDVLAGRHALIRLGLVAIELAHAAPFERGLQARIEPLGIRLELGLHRREPPHRRDDAVGRVGALQPRTGRQVLQRAAQGKVLSLDRGGGRRERGGRLR